MSYIVTSDYGSQRIDMPRFAADLAAELGGSASPWDATYPRGAQRISLPGNDYLFLRPDDYRKRVVVSAGAADVKHAERNLYAKDHEPASANVNPDGRQIAAIARDVKRRVIDASAAALAKQREYADEMRQNAGVIAAAAARLGELVNVTVADDGQGAQIYLNRNGVYVTARLQYGGKVAIDRIGSISEEKFAAIVRILAE